MAARKWKSAAAPEGGVVTVDAGELRGVLKRLADIVEARSTIPVLACVRLTTLTGFLTVEATDLDIVAQEQIEASGDSAWDVCVPATRLRIAADSADGELRLRAVDRALHIGLEANSGSFRLATLPAEEWPGIPEDATPVTARITLEAPSLSAALARVSPAMSTEETRYYLTGVCVETIAAGGLLLTATDGHRLAHVEIAAKGSDGKAIPKIEAIVPGKTVAILQGLTEGEIHVELRAGRIYAAVGRLRIWSRLIDGTFPDWRRVVPAGGGGHIVTCETAALRKAARALKPLDESRSKLLKVAIDGSRATVSARAGDDEGELAIDVEPVAGSGIAIGFNGAYLATICDQVGSERVQIEATGPESPVLLLPVGGHEADRFVLMPMRV